MAKIPLAKAGIGFLKEPVYGVKEAGEVPDQPYVFSFRGYFQALNGIHRREKGLYMSNDRVWTLERDGSHGPSAHLLCVEYSLNGVLNYLEAVRLSYHKEEEGWHLQIPANAIHDNGATMVIELRDGDDYFVIREWDMRCDYDYDRDYD